MNLRRSLIQCLFVKKISLITSLPNKVLESCCWLEVFTGCTCGALSEMFGCKQVNWA